jgi:hypothetical protein
MVGLISIMKHNGKYNKKASRCKEERKGLLLALGIHTRTSSGAKVRAMSFKNKST